MIKVWYNYYYYKHVGFDVYSIVSLCYQTSVVCKSYVITFIPFSIDLVPKLFETFIAVRALARFTECSLLLWQVSPNGRKWAKHVRDEKINYHELKLCLYLNNKSIVYFSKSRPTK